MNDRELSRYEDALADLKYGLADWRQRNPTTARLLPKIHDLMMSAAEANKKITKVALNIEDGRELIAEAQAEGEYRNLLGPQSPPPGAITQFSGIPTVFSRDVPRGEVVPLFEAENKRAVGG